MSKRIDLLLAGSLAEDVVFGESYFGGSAGNIALNCAPFGILPGILSVAGNDVFSESYLNFLSSKGVDVGLVYKNLNRLPQCVVDNPANHSSSKTWIDNGNSEALTGLEISEEATEVIHSARAVHITTVPAVLAERILREATGGCMVGYEPGPMVIRDPAYFSLSLFDKSKVLFVNTEEFDAISEKINLTRALEEYQSEKFIIKTMGEKGAMRISREEIKYYPSVEPLHDESVTDSSGAGDAFRSGFYSEYLKSHNLDKAIEMANLFGGQAVRQEGAILNDAALKTLGKLILTTG